MIRAYIGQRVFCIVGKHKWSGQLVDPLAPFRSKREESEADKTAWLATRSDRDDLDVDVFEASVVAVDADFDDAFSKHASDARAVVGIKLVVIRP